MSPATHAASVPGRWRRVRASHTRRLATWRAGRSAGPTGGRAPGPVAGQLVDASDQRAHPHGGSETWGWDTNPGAHPALAAADELLTEVEEDPTGIFWG